MIKKELSNGLKIHFDINSDYKYSCIMMFFGVGWRDDDTKKMGMSHLFEHLVGKRTFSYKNKGELHSVKNSYGIKFNAVTTPNSTAYYHSQLHGSTAVSLSLLLESIYNSYFDAQDLTSEKEVVKRERENYFDNKYNFLWDAITKKFFSHTDLANDMFGAAETLESISLQDFDNFYQGYLNPKNATLLLAVKDEKQAEEAMDTLEEFYKKCNKLTDVQFTKNKIDEKMLMASKNKIIFDIVSDCNLVKVLSSYRDAILNENEIASFKDKVKIIQNIQIKDILELIDYVFHKKECRTITIE